MNIANPLIFAACALLPLSALAENTPPKHYGFNDSETVPIELSSVDINRLVVEGDKITSIDCPEGFCVVTGTKSDKSGAARVNLNLAMPFTAYVSTEKGRHFGLFISPKAIPAVTSIFTAAHYREEQPSVFDKKTPYPTMMTEFTAHMIRYLNTGKPIDGYQVHIVNAPIEASPTHDEPRGTETSVDDLMFTRLNEQLPKPAGLTTEPAVVFTGKHFNGIIYRLTNHAALPVTLTTAQFYSPTTRAAALSAYELAPLQTGHLFVVSGGESMQ
ncbi:type-F conjugative transfer system secretin TraK (plasmid) [Shewanella baltica]|uniref:type-F conjugative transfer system secretin TraK n=1 Tax=Shewanella baltica TaxID=62322 RepID=UPI0030CC2714